MPRRIIYHTCIKEMTRRGTIPDRIKTQIHRSNIFRWENEQENKYKGYGLGDIETIEAFFNKKEALLIMRSYIRIIHVFKDIIYSYEGIKKHILNHKERIINEILKVKEAIKLKQVVKLFKISLPTFYYWVRETTKKCKSSAVKLCNKTYPGQLTKIEVDTIKNLLYDERFKYWPIYSIAKKALREKILCVSHQTWYKYVKILGLKRTLPKKIKGRFSKIRTNAPNQIWHADVTILRTLSGKKCYIYLLIDNFSRFILSWYVSDRISGNIRMETIKEAYEKHVKINPNKDILLVVDGGCENNNHIMEDYLGNDIIPLKKVLATKEIEITNNIIESYNKLLKYRYLFKDDYVEPKDVNMGLSWIIPDYNNKRPHVSLNGATPYEAHFGYENNFQQWHEWLTDAKKKRIEANQKNLCEICKK